MKRTLLRQQAAVRQEVSNVTVGCELYSKRTFDRTLHRTEAEEIEVLDRPEGRETGPIKIVVMSSGLKNRTQ